MAAEKRREDEMEEEKPLFIALVSVDSLTGRYKPSLLTFSELPVPSSAPQRTSRYVLRSEECAASLRLEHPRKHPLSMTLPSL